MTTAQHNGPVSVPTGVLMSRGFRRRCPVCGRGKLFRQWVRMEDSCPCCGLVFGRAPGHWLGSWFLNVCVAQAAVVLVLLLGVGFTWPDPPMWIIGTGVAAAAVLVPFVFFPFSRTIWTAIDLAMRPLDFDEGVPPGFELEADRELLDRERGDAPE